MSKINVVKNIEIRSIEEGNRLEIKGLLPSNTLSEVLFHPKKKVFFREKILPKAFATAISENTPKILKNHNEELEFKSAEFVELKETQRGLEFTVVMENEHGLKESLKDVKGLSFGMIVNQDLWEDVNGKKIRSIFSFASLYEISILVGVESAYSSTEVVIVPAGVKSQLTELEQYKLWLREEQLKVLKDTIEQLKK